MYNKTVEEDGSLKMRKETDNSGTYRVKYGEFETVYHVGESDLPTQAQ